MIPSPRALSRQATGAQSAQKTSFYFYVVKEAKTSPFFTRYTPLYIKMARAEVEQGMGRSMRMFLLMR
jgi:hypothetical protein